MKNFFKKIGSGLKSAFNLIKKPVQYAIESGALYSALEFLPDLLSNFIPEKTIVGTIIGSAATRVVIGGIIEGYKRDHLPSGLTRQLHKVPDKFTGVHGSKRK